MAGTLMRINALDTSGKPIGIEIEGERIKAVQPSHFTDPTLDLKDEVVLPQLIDAHNHPAPYNLSFPEKLLGDKQDSMGTFKSRIDWNGLWRGTSDDILARQKTLRTTNPQTANCAIYQYTSIRDIGAAVIQGFDPDYFKACVASAGMALGALKPNAREEVWIWKPDDLAKGKAVSRSSTARQATHGDPMVVHLAEGFRTEEPIRMEVNAAYYSGVLGEKEGGVYIHGLGFTDDELVLIRDKKGGIIWSPVSQQNLYSTTFDVRKALEKGLLIGLGADWALTGSPNILREMASAQGILETQYGYHPAEASTLALKMVTQNNAALLGLEEYAGIKPGMIASLTFVPRTVVLPKGTLDFKKLDESYVTLALHRGVATFGDTALMRKIDPKAEKLAPSDACHKQGVSKAVANLPEGMTYQGITDLLRSTFGSIPEVVQCD